MSYLINLEIPVSTAYVTKWIIMDYFFILKIIIITKITILKTQ